MKRRDVLKAGMVLSALSASSLLNACNSNGNDIAIKPKQTAIYEFSTPLPLNYSLIDEIADFNKTLKKSKIKTLYNSIPTPYALNLSDFQSVRGENSNIKSFEDFANYVKYANNKGFEFTYTLNSPKALLESQFKKKITDIDKLLDNLAKIKCKKVKVASSQLLEYLQTNYSNFELEASTSFEFHSISQYVNLVNRFPNIKTINLTLDENKNFKLLKSLRKELPHIKLELMANEACIFGCPARISHPCNGTTNCTMIDIIKKQAFLYIAKSRIIYPWELEHYSALGINNFKLMKGSRANLKKNNFLVFYLNLLENPQTEYSAKDFLKKQVFKHYCPEIKNETIKLSQIKPLFPKIEYFVKNGHNCSANCGSECRYCYNCAKELEKALS